MMTLEITTSSREQTVALGSRFAPMLTAGDIVILSGRLGAGKTAFVSGVAAGLGITERITSPSFIIVRMYDGGFLPLVHADAYRLGTMAEFYDLELPDDGANGAVLIEWGDAIADSLPMDRLKIRFEISGDERIISFHRMGQWQQRDLGVLA
jgi:tRNA threonylcarbamoyladenosine biosynthesis protein TsaE